MHFEVLGSPRVLVSGDVLQCGGPQQQKLLVLLVASANQSISVDRLIDEVWGGEPPASARHLVQVYVSRLRSLFKRNGGSAEIRREGQGYSLQVPVSCVDALRLEDLVREATALREDSPAAAAKLLGEARALWRGRPFGDFSYEAPLLSAESARLEELYLQAVAALTEIELDLGRHAELVGELEQLTEAHPYNERLRQNLMMALYRDGRQVEALRV